MKYRFSLPRMDDLLDSLSGARYFTSIDLKNECKSTFKTNNGFYGWLIMPLGLTNVLSKFMTLMATTLQPFSYKFVFVYLDDILIYSGNKGDHLAYQIGVGSFGQRGVANKFEEVGVFHICNLVERIEHGL